MTEKKKESGMIGNTSWRSWERDILPILLLFVFAFWVNRGIEIRGLYMDDLYLWSCYGEQSFRQFIFPLGSTRFRFLYYLAAWVELALIGPHVGWIVPINIILNALVAVTIYKMARSFSHSVMIATLCGISWLASRMAYYQIAQTYGLMETLALWLAVGILYLLCRYRTGQGKNKKLFYAACILYFMVCFVHERYMVLIPLFILVLVYAGCRDWKQWAASVGVFALVQLIRLVTIGTVLPAGTGRTQVADTFSMGEAVRYALCQVAYVFGINAGPEYLNGESISAAPIWILLLIGVADLMLVGLTGAFVLRLIREWKNCWGYLQTITIFLGFIAGCIACSSVTIRVEMRWVYVSYAASLLFLSWMYGVLTKDLDRKSGEFLMAAPYALMITAYVMLMLPVELYYRGLYPNLYFWSEQTRYNSLAEVTYGVYGEEIFGKQIIIVGDDFDMSDFTEETFFKVFDPERTAENTQIRHIEDVREIGLVSDDMLILQEDAANDRYLDITLPVRTWKCRGLYGYYTDGWIDENAEIQVMAGSTGEIEMSFYYPGEITGDEWITIYVNGDAKEYLELSDQQTETFVTTQPYKTVTLRFKTNFYVRDAQEQRGEDHLAAILTLTAD